MGMWSAERWVQPASGRGRGKRGSGDPDSVASLSHGPGSLGFHDVTLVAALIPPPCLLKQLRMSVGGMLLLGSQEHRCPLSYRSMKGPSRSDQEADAEEELRMRELAKSP